MASRKGISPANFRKIYERQTVERWDADYIPSILATVQEAPSISRASTLGSALLNREVHTLSLPERYVGMLALHYPNCEGLQEQKVMFPFQRAHPLFGQPGVLSTSLPEFKGVIDVAERLGYLSRLPKMSIDDPANPGQKRNPVYPFVSDFLIRLRPANGGQSYCVNWSVKDSEVAFKRPPLRGARKRKKGQGEDPEVILARHELEELYYNDAGIRTHRIAGNQLHPHLVANLEICFGYHHKTALLPSEQQSEIVQKLQIALDTGIPPREVILSVCSRTKATVHDCRVLLYKAIWLRKLRVDLFSPVLINRPLKPEKRDVFEVYADWLKGQP